MSVPATLKSLVGTWRGTGRLWLPSPDGTTTVYDSPTEATVAAVAQGAFATIAYTWSFEGQPAEGLLLIGGDGANVSVAWGDSWHMSDVLLISPGGVDADGMINVLGAYAAPEGPDWGWRTVIDPGDGATWRLVMYNILPDGQEFIAVENRYERAEG